MNLFDGVVLQEQPEPGGKQPGNLFANVQQEQIDRANAANVSSQFGDEQQAQRAIRVAKELNLPPGVVQGDLPYFEQKAATARNAKIIQSSPALSQWMTQNPQMGIAAKNHVQELSGIERFWNAWSRGLQIPLLQEDLTKATMPLVYGQTLTPDQQARMEALNSSVRELEQDRQKEGKEYGASMLGYGMANLWTAGKAGVKGAIYGGTAGAVAGSVLPGVGTAAGAAAGAYVGGSMGLAQYSYEMEAAANYLQLRDVRDVNGKPLDPETVRTAAKVAGVINGTIEIGSDVAIAAIWGLMPGGTAAAVQGQAGKQALKAAVSAGVAQALTNPTKRAAVLGAMKKLIASGGTEGLEELFQNFVSGRVQDVAERSAGGKFPERPFAEETKEGLRQAAEAFGSTVLSFGLVGSVPMVRQMRQINQAQRTQAYFKSLGEAVSDSEINKAFPDATESFIQELKQSSVIKDAYIGVNYFDAAFQGEGSLVAQELGLGEQYAEAKAVGGDLVIPIETYAAKIAGTEAHNMLLPDLRLAQGELSMRELKEVDSRVQTILKEQAAGIEEQAKAEEPLQKIYNHVYDQLKTVMGETEANRNAVLWRERYRARAERTGMDAWALYSEKPITVKRDVLSTPETDVVSQSGQEEKFVDDKGFAYFKVGAEVKQSAYPNSPARVVSIEENADGNKTRYTLEVDTSNDPESVDDNGAQVKTKRIVVQADELNRLNPSDTLNQSAVNTVQGIPLDQTYGRENRTGIIIGARPGVFGWSFANGKQAPPIQVPTQSAPDITRVGDSVQKILKSNAFAKLIKDAFGIDDIQVHRIEGSWGGVAEPSFVIQSESMTFDQAVALSKMLGFAFSQEAAVVTQPYAEGEEGLLSIYAGSKKKLTQQQLTSVKELAKKKGLDYSSTVDGRAVKFLYFGEPDGVDAFIDAAKQIAAGAGLAEFGAYKTRSDLNDSETYLLEGGEGSARSGWSQDTGSGPSDLFRRAVDSLIEPYARAVGAQGYRFSPDLFAERFGLSDSQREVVRDALLPTSGKARSTVPLLDGTETLPVGKSSQDGKTNNTDVMVALQNRAAASGVIESDDYSNHARKVLAQAIADEIRYHVNRGEGKSAIGWYDSALKKAKSIYQEVFPELAVDKDKELLFDAFLGITSQGNDVYTNSTYAGRVYFLTQREGKTISEAVHILRGSFGSETRAIENNLLKLEELINRNGINRMRDLLNEKKTVSEWNAILRKDKTLFFKGKALKMEGAARQKVTGWMMFGPKIGSFINNLHGDYSTLTADLWFSRTWNRLLGFMFHHTPAQEADKYQSFRRALLAEVESGNEDFVGPYTPKRKSKTKFEEYEHGRDVAGMPQEEVDQLIADPDKMLALAQELEGKFRNGFDYDGKKKAGYSTKSDLRRAAKNWIEHRDDSVEAPRTSLERAFQQDTMEAAQKLLKKEGVEITIADMQAALWYHEKELYASFGVGGKTQAPADYADAAAQFVDRYRNGDLFFVDAHQGADPRYIHGSKGFYLGGGELVLNQPAYHGSGKDFWKFSTQFIGTGEGAQAYGWGLYFAESPEVATGYFRQLADDPSIEAFQVGRFVVVRRGSYVDYSPRDATALENVKATIIENLLVHEHELRSAAATGKLNEYVMDQIDYYIKDYFDPENDQALIKAAEQFKKSVERWGIKFELGEKTGGVYQVDIPDAAVAQMLDWDAPLSKQPFDLRAALERIPARMGLIRKDGTEVGIGSMTTGERYAKQLLEQANGLDEAIALGKEQSAATESKRERIRIDDGVQTLQALKKEGATWGEVKLSADATGEDLYMALSKALGSDEQASKFLLEQGVPGIKYKDAFSRGDGKDQVTRNLVVFDDAIIKITHKDGKELTPQEQSALMAQSPSASKPRASINVRTNEITLLRSSDPSSFLHESAHAWLEELRRDAMRAGASEQVRKDWEIIAKWAGIPADLPADQMIPVEAHEKWARGTELYVREGNSPSNELRAAFARFKDWLSRIYRSALDLDVQISPEVRGVMDRVLATDDQIQRAREESGADEQILAPDWMTEAEKAALNKLRTEAREEAETRVRTELMNELVRERTDFWKSEKKNVTEEVTSEVDQQPVYIALSALQTGKLPDGREVPGLPPGTKLSRDAIVALRGEEFLRTLPRPYIFHLEGGLHPDVAAQMFGFKTGEEMLTAIAGAQDKNTLIAEEVDARMRERHGDMLNDGSLAERAAQAVSNEKQMSVYYREMQILLRQGATGKLVPMAELQRMAKDIIAAKKIGKLSPAYYEAAAAKAGRDAIRAAVGAEPSFSRKLNAMFEARQRQILNLALFKEAAEVRQEMKKSLTAWRILRRSDERLAKTRNMDLVNTARAILAGYGIGAIDRSPQSYMELMNQYDPKTYADLMPLVDLVSENKPFEELTVDEFRTVKDAVDGLMTLARTANQMLIDGRRMSKDEVKAALMARIDEFGKPAVKRGYDRAVTDWEHTKINLMGIRSALRRVEAWVRSMDDADPQGVFRKYVWQPISEAADQYRDSRRVALQKYLDIVKPIEKSITIDKINAPELANELAPDGYQFGANGSGKAELLGALLHTGNLSNLTKLLIGRGWGELREDGTLNTSKWDAFIARMQQEGILTKADYDYVQNVWDLLESLKPQAQAAHKELYGYYFSEVTANKFQTPYGEYRGGYFPATTDPRVVIDAALREDKNALEGGQNSFMFPTTGRGFTMKRIENYAKALVLDMRLATRSIDTVLKFSYLEPRVREVGRLVLDREFRESMDKVDPTAISDMLTPWLQRTATQAVETPSTSKAGRAFNDFWRGLRNRTGAQIMVMNVTNTIQQFTGLSIAATIVSPQRLGSSLMNYIQSPLETANWIAEKSTFMRNRVTTAAIEVQSQIDDIVTNPSKYEKLRDFTKKHGYFMQTATQSIVDVVVWRAAYDQAIGTGATEKDAVRQADSAVRLSQGTFAAEDVSRFETGQAWARAFTMFYSYFNMQANLLGTEFAREIRERGFSAPGRLFYVYALGFAIPAILSEALVQAMSGEAWHDDDDDGYIDNILSIIFGGQGRALFGLIPGVGNVLNYAMNLTNSKRYDDRISTSPTVSMLETMARTAVQYPYQYATDQEINKKMLVKDVLTTVGMATGLPLAWIGRPLGYYIDVQEGKAEPTGPVDYARGLISGRHP